MIGDLHRVNKGKTACFAWVIWEERANCSHRW